MIQSLDGATTQLSLFPETSPDTFTLRELVVDDEARVEKIWADINSIRILLDDDEREDERLLLRLLNQPRNVFLEIMNGDESAGLLMFLNVIPGGNCVFRPMVFDRALKGKEPVMLAGIKQVFQMASLARMTTYTPQDRRAEAKFLPRLGFKHEGRLRRFVTRFSRIVDVHVFGLLPEEVPY